jgi:hypothetical protein
MKYYKGKFKPKNLKKYEGDFSNITYRSHWERQAFRWCDNNKDIVGWNSEEVVVSYKCKTDGKMHRYFIDLFIRMKDGKCYLIEIKPKKQTQPPKERSRKTKKYLNEVMTYVKNVSKWEAATAFASHNGMAFQVWNEDTLKSLGIKLLT